MGLLKRLLGREPKMPKLLAARIIVDEDHRYFVSFQKHHPELVAPEFARLVLHYYAKILFNFDPADPQMFLSAVFLRDAMQKVLDQGISVNSDIFQAAEIGDVATFVKSPPQNIPREIIATLYFVSEVHRHITTRIPGNIYAQQAVFSVFALLQATLQEVDVSCFEILQAALGKMNEVYESGQSYSDLGNLSVVPNMAYMSAVMRE